MCKEKYRVSMTKIHCGGFLVLNDNNIVDERKFQIMHYIYCHISLIIFNPRTKERKGIISYYK